jgi:hypothetical protein
MSNGLARIDTDRGKVPEVRHVDRTVGSSHAGAVVMEKIQIEQHGFMGGLWFAGWLFTLGYLQLTFWKGLLALVVWPYYLGAAANPLLH